MRAAYLGKEAIVNTLIQNGAYATEKNWEKKLKRKKSEDEDDSSQKRVKSEAYRNYNDIVVWFQEKGGLSLPTSESYAKLLIDNDIASIAKLKWKVKKNKNILVFLGIDAEEAEYLLLEENKI